MYEVFTKLLNMSLTASILVLLVIILRIALKKAPKKYICILWALVAIRLICPFSISSSLSAYNVLQQDTISSGQVEYFEYNGKTEKPQLTFEVPALVNDNYSPDSMTIGTKTSGVYMPTVVYIWVFGVILMLGYAVVSYARLCKEVKASIKKDNNIFVCDEINSPFILGLIRPRIYLPSGISEEVRNNVIAHEKAHIKRLDYIWKPLGFILLSVYWFNPVMWVAYIFLCKDIEAACDEKVISQMDKDSIASYSQALLACASQRRMITACPIAFGETDVKGRIKNVLNYKKPAFWIICISVIACIAVAVCFLTNPKEDKKNSEVVFGTYVKNDATEDPMLYWSGLTIYEDGTFTYSPSVISSYMGAGNWTIDGDHVIFNDIGMGDVRKEVFRYIDGKLYYAEAESATNSMWGLADGTEYVLKTDVTAPVYDEKNENEEDSQKYSNGIEIGDIDYNGVDDFIIFEDGTFDRDNSFKWTLVLNGNEIYTAYNVLHCDFDVSFLDLDGDSSNEILILVYPHVNSASLTEFVVLKEKGDSWTELQKVSELNPNDGYAFPIKITMGEGIPISMNIACEGIDYVLNEDISRHYEIIAAGDDYFDEDGSFARDILSGELYESGEEFAHISPYGIWEIKIDAENGMNCLVARHGIESNAWGKNDTYGSLDVWFNYDLSGKIRIFKIKYNPFDARYVDGTSTSDTLLNQSLKWDDFGFDCWPLADGSLRDEWSEETPFWQFTAPKGTAVYAVKDGTAVGGYDYDDGNYVILSFNDTNNTCVKYCHLDTQYFDKPRFITAGTEIGTVGATGKATGPFLKVEINTDLRCRKVTDAEVISKTFSFAGVSGKLTVDVTEEAITQPVEMEVLLQDNNEKTVWKTELGIPHMGWNAYYVYSYNETDYLIEYYPSVSQGQIAYSFKMYEFDANGNVKVVDERYAVTSDEVTEFLEYTKQYMDKAQLFISTINGVITTGI